ncbi:MAG: formate dehydrogenase accessory sulfurtransferase FdhD [Chloroflexota bacterium]
MDISVHTVYNRFESGQWKEIETEAPVETDVALTVNGEVWTTFMCTPILVEEMMAGFLFNEGIIQGMEDVADIRTCEHGDNVDVWTTRSVEQPSKWRRTSGCAGGVTAVAADASVTPLQADGWRVSSGQITRLVELLFESQELYRETGGIHTSALSDGEQVILSAEDIGRHNTLDKIAGLWLARKLQVAHPILITTGRISSEMLQKGLRMGANILVSRTAPSSMAIQLAERYGVTLVGYARRHRFNLYTHPERISNEQP